MKAAIYCRLSEEDRNKHDPQDDSVSIQNQKAMLIQYARDQGWSLYDIYSDEDYTGSDRNRPQFRRLISDARERKFDIILCKTQSRFTRELELVEKYIHGLFPVWGIRFVSIVDNADTANRGNKKSRQINGLVNEWYLEDLSDNIRSVLTSRRENGFHIGSFAPYGYRKDPDRRGHLLIDEEAAGIIREIFVKFAQGQGKTAIARELNDRGIPNPAQYRFRQGLTDSLPPGTYGSSWKYRTIAGILTNEVYIGNLVQGKYESISYKTKQLRARPRGSWIVVSDTHEPIIDRELWDRVQGMVRSRAKARGNGQIHPLARMVRCACCGYTLKTHQNRGRYYLQCTNRMIAKDACPGAFIPLKELEQLVLGALSELNRELLDRDMLVRGIEGERSADARIARAEREHRDYIRRKEELERVCRQLCIDRTRGLIPEEEFASLYGEFSSEKTHCTQLLAECTRVLDAMAAEKEQSPDPQTWIGGYIAPDSLTREMAVALIDHVSVSRRDRRTGQVPVKIHWNF